MTKADQEWTNIDGDNTLRLDYPLTKDSIVFDVGGYVGDWSACIYAKYNCKIWIFEPVYNAKLFARFGTIDKIRIVGAGLASEQGLKTFGVNKDSTSAFKHSPEMIPCNVRGIDCFDNFEHIDLIKINIEGGEYSLLNAILDKGIITKFTDIQVQFHDFIDKHGLERDHIRKRLKKTHKCTYDYPFVWENWRLK